jgi:hypothetical protein
MEPTSPSANGFCQGDRGAVSTSSIPISRGNYFSRVGQIAFPRGINVKRDIPSGLLLFYVPRFFPSSLFPVTFLGPGHAIESPGGTLC